MAACAVRTIVETMPGAEQSKAWPLLGEFETRKAG